MDAIAYRMLIASIYLSMHEDFQVACLMEVIGRVRLPLDTPAICDAVLLYLAGGEL